jgi:hypothetical protein
MKSKGLEICIHSKIGGNKSHPSTQIYGSNRRKTPQIAKSKIRPKIHPKITKMENIAAQDR